MFFRRYILLIFLFCALFFKNAAFSQDFLIYDILTDNSDKTLLIRGQGNYQSFEYGYTAPVPMILSENSKKDSIVTFSTTNPTKYFIDIPNSTLKEGNKSYKLKNSKVIQTVELIQHNANTTRVIITLINDKLLQQFKTYSDGTNIIVKYNNQLVSNSIQHKFYTPSGDMDKTSIPQNTYFETTNNIDNTPKLQNKYYLTMISQDLRGLILRGIGELSLQKINYSENNTKAEIILDSTGLHPDLENKTYSIPTPNNKNLKTTLTINKLNDKKIKITLLGESLRDYRAVISPDNQSLFISHRANVLNTAFAVDNANIASYNVTKNTNGYYIFDLNFDKSVAYDIFELNGSLYLDINNLPEHNAQLLNKTVKNQGFNIQAMKISQDKARYIIPLEKLNFAYANIESNSKSIKLCFKEKPQPKVQNTEVVAVLPDTSKTKTPQIMPLPEISNNIKYEKDESKSGNINVVYVPKEEDNKKVVYKEPKRKKHESTTISALKKVVLDPGHGGVDPGAISTGNVYEKNLNLVVAKLIEEKLKKKNVHVYMTRSTDEFISLEDRVNFSNEISPDIYISIHANSTVQNTTYGLETHYFKSDSLELANTMHACFASEKNLKKWGTKNRGVINSRFYVINHTEAPSVLIEMGFISNQAERENLITKQRQEEIATAIADGIFEYLKVKK